MKKFDVSQTSDWTPIATVCLYCGDEEHDEYLDQFFMDLIEEIGARWDVDGWGYTEAKKNADPEGRFANRTTCDHCGAHFLYGAAFSNETTGEIMVVGNTCARSLGLSTLDFADKQMRDAVRRVKERGAADAAIAKLAPNRRRALEHDHNISKDLRRKFRQWHNLSIKQWALAKKLLTEADSREEEEREDPPKPIPEALLDGRHDFEGVMLGFKSEPGYTSWDPDVIKMVFKDDRGFRLYGTAPAGLFHDGHNTSSLKGLRARFTAAVERSRKDETFGFIKRPTCAVVMEEGEPA